MKIQSLSVVVPNPECVNHCRFCVSRMHKDEYKNQMDDNLPYFDLYVRDYIKRLEYARDNGCNTVMLTGSSEPQQNRKFLTYFGLFIPPMSMTQFSFTFQGKIDTSAIANSILQLLGENGCGKVEVVCTL